ncbi:MAG: hypothetical protein ACJA1A_003620 [Saprospiraceae bacterium]|jgi:uncharacterized protein (DUF58 family)
MNLYLKRRFYIGIAICIVAFLLGYSYPIWYEIGWWCIRLLVFLVVIDFSLLKYNSKKIHISRNVSEKLSLGDIQHIQYEIINESKIPLQYELTDELPMQLQHRNFIQQSNISAEDRKKIKYRIRPTIRGVYSFGKLHTYVNYPFLGLVQRRISANLDQDVAVYPSFIQMRNFELQVFSQTANMSGIRRVRQIGENDEFEHIRNYVQGDNIRSINWKATSRNGELMVNQYENSRSQMVYCIIDKGRSMKMPFGGLTLLDYAVNTSLVLSNIILKKHDRAGLITFSDKIGAIIKASAQHNHLQKLTSYLYNQTTGFSESNFELLFYTLRSQLSRRSVLLFFTNFEQPIELKRNLKYLKSLNQKHLLVVIMFKNTELESVKDMPTTKMKDIYYKTFSQKALMEKEKIAAEIKANGIQVILTAPEDLSVNTVNKYLEIKAKRMR